MTPNRDSRESRSASKKQPFFRVSLVAHVYNTIIQVIPPGPLTKKTFPKREFCAIFIQVPPAIVLHLLPKLADPGGSAHLLLFLGGDVTTPSEASQLKSIPTLTVNRDKLKNTSLTLSIFNFQLQGVVSSLSPLLR